MTEEGLDTVHVDSRIQPVQNLFNSLFPYLNKQVFEKILTSQFLLPLHLIVKKWWLVKEITNFAALLILLCGSENSVLGLFCQELTDVWNREYNLLHASI